MGDRINGEVVELRDVLEDANPGVRLKEDIKADDEPCTLPFIPVANYCALFFFLLNYNQQRVTAMC